MSLCWRQCIHDPLISVTKNISLPCIENCEVTSAWHVYRLGGPSSMSYFLAL